MEKYIENKDGWTRSGSHNSPLRFVYRSLYKTKIDENTIFQSIRLLYFFLVVASVEEKSIHVICSKQKALVLTKCLLVLS